MVINSTDMHLASILYCEHVPGDWHDVSLPLQYRIADFPRDHILRSLATLATDSNIHVIVAAFDVLIDLIPMIGANVNDVQLVRLPAFM